MKIEIKIPSFGESVVEATIGAILKPSGSSVLVDDDILELETDKLNQVLHASHSGQIQLSVKTGDIVRVGQIIGTIDSDAPAVSASPKVEKPKESLKKAPSTLHPARKKVDEAMLEMGKEKLPESMPAPVATGKLQKRVKMTKLRKVIAERLVQVKNQTAMLTTFNEVDMSTVIAVREREQENFQKKHGIKLGFMSFFIKASVAALQEFPEINGQIEGDEIVYNEFFDISVAVSTDKGLMVPVIRGADFLSYEKIEKQLKTLAEKARTGSIAVDDLQGGTFTITNAGLFGSLLSTPILNPGQSGILGMHNIVKRAVVVGDEIVIRPMMYLALSYDHRIVDGKQAVLFLMHIKKNLEEPARLLLDL
jgi:2-oxoglutarate dehydrogenase E2 component (dihydrolipoamide succinyltransferase)